MTDAQTALFTVRKPAAGSGCHIRVIMPDGSTEEVYGFETLTKASDWIESQSQEWLAKHRKSHRRGPASPLSGRYR